MSVDLETGAGSFLRDRPNLVLSTIRRDGSPQSSVVWFLWTGTSFLISTVDTTAKWRNLQRDPRCSICVDDPGGGRMVVAYGVATLHSDDIHSRTADLVAKYYPGEPKRAEAHVQRIFDAPAKRVIIEVVPDQTITRNLDGM
jgi:PPOX class probable F420-dependent enzyme